MATPLPPFPTPLHSSSMAVPNSTSSIPSFGRRTPSSSDLSLFFLKIPSLRPSSLSGSRRLRVSAGLELRRRRRASKRRSTLREKLVDGEPTQVRGTPEESGPRVDSQVGLVPNDEKRRSTLMRFCPQIGLTVLVGYFVYWAVKNPLFGGERSEPTSEEKEMLRRKLKARKESNTEVVGNVEVVQDAKELLVGLDKRPELDRDELMKNIIEAKTSKTTSVMLESSSDSSVCGHRFEDKIREIREMARKARESESLELQSNNNGEQTDIFFNENNLPRPSFSPPPPPYPQHSNNSGVPKCDTNSNQENDAANHNTESGSAQGKKNWMEENFKKFDPVVEKIRVGFRENYMIAKEKKEDQKLINAEISELGLMEDDEELQWMNDEKLRDIVFQVRDNELAGREPFHLMSNDDQHTYFAGLVKKAEKVNGKLLGLHEFIHSRIENIDYGADGISVHDPIEKIMPRWKGPPIDKGAEFLNNPIWNKQASAEGSENASTIGDNGSEPHKSQEQSCTNDVSGYSVHNIRKPPNGGSSKPRTVIECSDGSSKVGKKGGKEHWQHTKKWSREFLELYNAETDPKTKSVMRDIGKDLDKWIAEKEIQDVADLMTRIPKKKRQFIEKKLDKLKREVEMFGPQAVVSKYREYSGEKEEDYLWWLDLKFVLCIELYNVKNDAQKIGFYSLEMAEDLELNPKQYHIVAFEDPGDAKNFCYIMQAHLEMLGKGRAFVVPQPPKDAFREAKANGFHVTVIRKGEIKLNIDQTLEEVEEEILEIGTKMYHDKIVHERGVDMGTLMKGVFASEKSNKKR